MPLAIELLFQLTAAYWSHREFAHVEQIFLCYNVVVELP
jgi:hypothetical protein